MKNCLTKKTASTILDVIDRMAKDFWGEQLEESKLFDSLNLNFSNKINEFEEVDGMYEMTTDLGPNAKDAKIEVNVDGDGDNNILEVTTKISHEDGDNKSSSETYFSTTLPIDADPDSVTAKLSKDGKLKISIVRLKKALSPCDNEDIPVTRKKSKK